MITMLSGLPVWSLTSQDTQGLVMDKSTAISRALAVSSALSEAKNKLEIARERLSLDVRRWFPQLSLSYQQSDTTEQENADTHTRQIAVGLSQVLFDGGVAATQSMLAKQELLAQVDALSNAELELQTKTADLFLSLRIQKELEKVGSENLDAAHKQLKLLEVEVRQGSATSLDLVEARIELRKQELEQKKAEAAGNKLDFEFRTVLKLEAQPYQLLDDFLIGCYRGRSFRSTDKLKGLLLAKNAEHRAKENAVRQAECQAELVKRTWIPTLSLNVQGGAAGKSFPLTVPTFSASLSLSFPSSGSPLDVNSGIGSDGPANRNRNFSTKVQAFKDISGPVTQKEALLALEAARHTLAETDSTLVFTLAFQLNAYQQAKEELAAAAELLMLGERRLELSETTFRQGNLKRLDLIKARLEQNSRSIELYKTIRSLVAAEASLMSLIGVDPKTFDNLSDTEYEP